MDDREDNILLLKNRVDDDLVIPETHSPSETTGEDTDAQIWAYMGVGGGAGVTSLAIQTAHELACQGKRVCLIDLDFETGSCAAYLDTSPSLSIVELNAGEARMDEDLAATFIGSYQKFSLIAAHGELGGNDQVRPGAVLALLDIVCQMYEFVILDISPMWRPWTQAAIGAADQFGLVTEMRVPCLHRAQQMSESIVKALDLPRPPSIILNKFERRSLRNSVTLKDAQKVMDRIDLVQIISDEDTVRTCINCGQAAGQAAPDSRYVKSIWAHVQKWQGLEMSASKQTARKFPSLMKRDRRRA